MDGFFLIDKPAGYSSAAVLDILKRRFSIKKMGHTGTLDPFATGLLVVGVGEALKQISQLNDEPKIYEAVLRLGIATDTMDRTGKAVKNAPVLPLAENEVKKKIAGLVGPQDQIPPMYSAKKVGGKKLYELARKGMTVERKAVPITIHDLEVLNVRLSEIVFRVSCSRGTYVRVLAETMAERLGTVGHLAALRRLAAGPYRVEEACDPFGDWRPEEKIILVP